ncbi:MAG: transcription termination/antitermination protein NusA, partial [Campylobacterales bacterium]|nr:transcription termination/antitermination protein NusA [Campylobacterales bacterium]
YEKGLRGESVKDALLDSTLNTSKSMIDQKIEFCAEIDEKSKSLKLFQKVVVVENDDTRAVSEPKIYMKLVDARKYDDEVEIGDELRHEIQFDSLGRSTVNHLYREFEHEIQRLIKNQLFGKYKSKKGKIITGTVVRVDDNGNTFLEINEVKAVMPLKNRIKGENFKVGNVVKGVLKDVKIDKTYGIYLELSRTSPKFLEELLALEVPEIKDKAVEIKKCSRIPGERAKVALYTTNPKIDPIGSTVGVKGMRINSISKELKNESIDCIEYSPIPEMFVARSLSPAIIKSVKIDGTVATVTIPSDQKAKAIGRSGINIRLANLLTGYTIELIEQDSSFEQNLSATMTQQKIKQDDNDESPRLASLFKD